MKEEYKQKLSIQRITLPDPLKFSSEWIGEKGIRHWPRIVYGDIVYYFKGKRGLEPSEILHKYKEGKACSYLECDFVKEILVHRTLRRTSASSKHQ